MVITMSSEATAVAILVKNWFPSISLSLLGSLLIVSITLLNLLGAKQLGKLESALAAIKLFAIVAFIILGFLLITGILFGSKAIGLSVIWNEPFLQGGILSFLGSFLIVIFTYAGFEIIGLAASETRDKERTVPKAIHITVFSLVSLYILSITILLLLIPTDSLSETTSPLVSALERYHLTWAGDAMNFILISAILSTMLAAMFGIGRMLRSLVEDALAPTLLLDHGEVPKKGILFSGLCMLISLFIGLLFPRVYLFLISSGGFSLLFTYIILMLTHIRFRKQNGKPKGRCYLGGYPYSSLFTLLGLLVSLFSMPFMEGQRSGFLAGILLILFFYICYGIMKWKKS
ncbi:MAG: hypothetical protein PWP24_1673 [Clostridiales bacterium]|nr:hypothetical protein [Clostridiales bacterium]